MRSERFELSASLTLMNLPRAGYLNVWMPISNAPMQSSTSTSSQKILSSALKRRSVVLQQPSLRLDHASLSYVFSFIELTKNLLNAVN